MTSHHALCHLTSFPRLNAGLDATSRDMIFALVRIINALLVLPRVPEVQKRRGRNDFLSEEMLMQALFQVESEIFSGNTTYWFR